MLPLPLSPKLNEKGETFSMEQRSRLDCSFARYLGKQIWSIIQIWFFFLDLNVTYNLRLVSCFRMLARWKVSPLRLEVSKSCWWSRSLGSSQSKYAALENVLVLNHDYPFEHSGVVGQLGFATRVIRYISWPWKKSSSQKCIRASMVNSSFMKKMDTIILEEKPISKNGFFKFLSWFSLDLFGH